MAGSSSSSFSWTSQKIGAALNTSLQVMNGGKDDPFTEKNLKKAVSKLNKTLLFSYNKLLSTDALSGLLYEYRARHKRICEISDLPYGNFSTSEYKIIMSTDDYEKHVKAYPEDVEFINKDIPYLAEMTMLFALGSLPGWRKRRRPRRRPVERMHDNDDFMAMPPPRQPTSPEKPEDHFSGGTE